MNSVTEKEKKLNLALTKLKNLNKDYNKISKKVEEFQDREKMEQKKQIEFSEKIDELNQETNILMDEVDKWQT